MDQELRTALGALLVAANDARLAYRAVFGRSCWNDRDRQAFWKLEQVLKEVAAVYEQPAPKQRQSLQARLRAKFMP